MLDSNLWCSYIYKKNTMKNYYITAEEFDLMTEEQLDALDAEFWYEKWKMEQESMETDFQYCQ